MKWFGRNEAFNMMKNDIENGELREIYIIILSDRKSSLHHVDGVIRSTVQRIGQLS